jgi:Ni/Co efflux regulator RcnB
LVTVLCTTEVRRRIDDTSRAHYGSTSSWEKAMSKAKIMVAGLLAAALGFASTAQAQGWRDRADAQHQHQSQRQVAPQRQGHSQWQGHQQWQGQPQWQGHSQWQGQRRYAPQYQARAWSGYRGGYAAYAPHQRYRAYDWRARHLAQPPYGYQWVEDDGGEVLLMALATGLIANAILNPAPAPAPYYQAPYGAAPAPYYPY